MAEVPVSIACTIYPMEKSAGARPYKAMLVGYAWLTGLSAGRPLPGDQPQPEHPIVLPPPEEPPPDIDQPGGITITVKPAPEEGGWGINTEEGWYYKPGAGQAGPKRK